MDTNRKPLVHSHSSLELFETCPLKFYHEKVLKDIPFTETEQTKWGNDVHKALELAISKGHPLESRFEAYKKIVDKVLSLKGTPYTELKLAVNRQHFATDFFASDAYVRGIGDLILDYGAKMAAIDWKTGRQKHGSRQLVLMALLLFAKYPAVDEIMTAFVWLQNGKVPFEVYRRGDVDRLWGLFKQPFEELEWCYENDKWPARENFLCKKWCGVKSCIYNGLKQ